MEFRPFYKDVNFLSVEYYDNHNPKRPTVIYKLSSLK